MRGEVAQCGRDLFGAGYGGPLQNLADAGRRLAPGDALDRGVEPVEQAALDLVGEPTSSKGPSEGQRWVYFLSPWGMQFELVSYPDGKAFDRDPRAFD